MKNKLYIYQYGFMLAFCTLSNLFMSGVVASVQGSSAWIGFLIAIPVGLGINAIGAALFAKNPGKTLHQLNCKAFGKPIGCAASIVYSLYFMMAGVALLSYYSLYTADAIMGGPPAGLFMLIVVLAAVYTARRESEVLGRTAVLIGAFVVLLCVISTIMEFGTGDFRNLLPIDAVPADKLAWTVFAIATVQYGELLAVMLFAKVVEDKKRFFRATLVSVLAGNGLVALFAVGSVFLMGQTTMVNDVGFFMYVHPQEFSQVINMMELLLTTVYFFAIAFRLTISLRATAICTAEALSLPDERRIILPLGAMLVGVAGLFSFSGSVAANFLMFTYPIVAILPQIILPALTLIITSAKKARAT